MKKNKEQQQKEQQQFFPVVEPPSDSVSALEFTPKTAPFNGLCAASWDQTVRVWEVDSSSKTATPKSLQKMSAPLPDASWNGDGNRIYASDCTGRVFEWNLDANHVSQRKCHTAGVRACRWLWTPKTPLLMTASWDKTVKFWDTRAPQSVVSINLPERCYAADVLYPLAVVITKCATSSDGLLFAYALGNPYSLCPIYPNAHGALDPFEEHWTVIARRTSNEMFFFHNWREYKRGFANITGDFFMDKLQAITKSQT
ncbi:GL26269 [Drosophila persimilis]|uniref:GL26269 n=1 Tax=Drosophila persimilis TaxID=7234 RepID=B4GJD8_DROPE|nr:GL26269 [Drosophila persimilis]